jgi:hypothetical protein
MPFVMCESCNLFAISCNTSSPKGSQLYPVINKVFQNNDSICKGAGYKHLKNKK